MQFPRPCVAPNIRIVGIETFVDAVESSLNRIACETFLSERTRAHVGILAISRASGPVTKAHPRARGHSNPRLGPLIRTLTR